jgi:putative colanic acid biosynthesis UDP-glucose lipid carrier transferase
MTRGPASLVEAERPAAAATAAPDGRAWAHSRPRQVALAHVGTALRFADLLALALIGLAAHLARSGGWDMDGMDQAAVAVALLLYTNLAASLRVYEPQELGRSGRALRRAVGAWALAIAGLLALTFLLKTSNQLSRIWIIVWLVAGTATLLLLRGLARGWLARLRRRGLLARRALLVGSGPELRASLRFLEDNEPDLVVMGSLDLAGGRAGGGRQLTALAEVPGFLRTSHIDHVLIALPWREEAMIREVLDRLRPFPVEITLLPSLEARAPAIQELSWVGGLPGLKLLDRPLDEHRALVKSIEDRLLGCILLVLCAPLMLVIAALVRLTSPGPALYRQPRAGFNANAIEVYKFRSMYVDACDPPDAREVRQARRDDPRVTPLGRFLRRTSLDELPQLINVVRGEMSLVGPRPHALAHDDHYADLIDDYLARHRVKPGITGWAQINGLRGEVTDVEQMRRRIRYDLQYIDNWSLWFDFYILLRTVGLIFADRRAF